MPNETSAGSAVAASVGAPMVELFDDTENSVLVPESKVDYWTGRGFRRVKFDITVTASELIAYLEAAVPAVSEFVSGVMDDGEINPSDQAVLATANKAMNIVIQTWEQLVTDIQRKYPVVQAPGVRLADPDGNESDVDPSQVAEFKAKGWKEVQ